jgi:hypothetical protein
MAVYYDAFSTQYERATQEMFNSSTKAWHIKNKKQPFEAA